MRTSDEGKEDWVDVGERSESQNGMRERERERERPVEEGLLPMHEHGNDCHYDVDGKVVDGDETSDDEGSGSERGGPRGMGSSVKKAVWIALSTVGTLTSRRLLRDSFPYPIHFVLYLQLTAFCLVATILLVIELNKFRNRKRKSERDRYTWFERFVLIARVSVSACFYSAAMICGAEALMRYDNLVVLAMLPVSTYVSDSIIFRFLYCFRCSRQEGIFVEWLPFLKVIAVTSFLPLIVVFDYRLKLDGLFFALASFGLVSFAKSTTRIGPRLEKNLTPWGHSLYVSLIIGIPISYLTYRLAGKFENTVAAAYIAHSWSVWRRFMIIAPGVTLQVYFTNSLNWAHPFISKDLACGALEDSSFQGKEAVRSTLHTSFWVIIIGVLRKEQNLIDWLQVIAFTLIYIVAVGPKHIGYYPPRLLNLILRIFRRKPQLIHSEPWQSPGVLTFTNVVFAILMGVNTMYWVDTHAYNHNLKTWRGPVLPVMDQFYRPPRLRSFDIVIAHSRDDPIESITTLIEASTSVGAIRGFGPKVTVYSKDNSLDGTAPENLRGSWDGEVALQILRDSGGVTATYLHHILSSWEFMSQQTLFLSTTSPYPLSLTEPRLREYYESGGFPLPDAEPKTGFLNLGEHETCWCGECRDSSGWEDTFHLIPSMWGATRPESPKCESVLLTLGNQFLASSARIRGVKKDIWQLLYDALTKEDLMNAWGHDKEKLPKMLEGEERIGRWSEGGVYGRNDTLEEPVLQKTVERLWGSLLGCSKAEIAWRCPNLWRGWRIGGDVRDCSCVDS